MLIRTEVLKKVDACLAQAGIPTYTDLRDELCNLDTELERGRITTPRFRRMVLNSLAAGSSTSKVLSVTVNGVAVPPERRKAALEQANAMLSDAGMALYGTLRDAIAEAAIELETGRLSGRKVWRKRFSVLIANSSVDGDTAERAQRVAA